MSLQTEYIDHANYLRVVLKGPFSFKQAVDAFPGVITHCQKNGLEKVLIDLSGIEGQVRMTERMIGMLEIYDLYETYLGHGGVPLKLAMVGGTHVMGPYTPAIDLGRQRGLPFRIFVTCEEAMEWLGLAGAS